jgi:hypothetical protein
MNFSQTRRSSGGLPAILKNIPISRGAAFGIMIIGALLAFEVFNFSTTDFALRDVLGDLRFMSIRWSTILSIAFCGIDFAGIARLFTPEKGRDEPAEVWYLFGAWLLAAAMNAILTWWGVSVAIGTHVSQGSQVIGSAATSKVVPVFVAIMVWVIRVLIIGTFSVAGERLFTEDAHSSKSVKPVSTSGNGKPRPSFTPQPQTYQKPTPSFSKPYQQQPSNNNSVNRPVQQSSFSPASRPVQKPEPTYHNMSSSAVPTSDSPGKSLSYEASSRMRDI